MQVPRTRKRETCAIGRTWAERAIRRIRGRGDREPPARAEGGTSCRPSGTSRCRFSDRAATRCAAPCSRSRPEGRIDRTTSAAAPSWRPPGGPRGTPPRMPTVGLGGEPGSRSRRPPASRRSPAVGEARSTLNGSCGSRSSRASPRCASTGAGPRPTSSACGPSVAASAGRAGTSARSRTRTTRCHRCMGARDPQSAVRSRWRTSSRRSAAEREWEGPQAVKTLSDAAVRLRHTAEHVAIFVARRPARIRGDEGGGQRDSRTEDASCRFGEGRCCSAPARTVPPPPRGRKENHLSPRLRFELGPLFGACVRRVFGAFHRGPDP